MSQRLQDHASILTRLVKSRNKQRHRIIAKSDDELIKCLSECAENTLNSNVPLTPAQLKKLTRHKKIVRCLACKKTSLKTKRKKILKQTGGFLLPLLIPIISAILQNI
jgi:CHAD domain-containing protein